MRSKQLKRYNLSPTRAYNEVLDSKPYLLFTILIIIGIYFISASKFVSGGILILANITSFVFFPPSRLIEFYDDNMILYNKAGKTDCTNIYYEDVKSWKYDQGVKYDEITFTLADGSIQKINSFSKLISEKYLNKYLKNKLIKGESIWKFQRH